MAASSGQKIKLDQQFWTGIAQPIFEKCYTHVFGDIFTNDFFFESSTIKYRIINQNFTKNFYIAICKRELSVYNKLFKYNSIYYKKKIYSPKELLEVEKIISSRIDSCISKVQKNHLSDYLDWTFDANFKTQNSLSENQEKKINSRDGTDIIKKTGSINEDDINSDIFLSAESSPSNSLIPEYSSDIIIKYNLELLFYQFRILKLFHKLDNENILPISNIVQEISILIPKDCKDSSFITFYENLNTICTNNNYKADNNLIPDSDNLIISLEKFNENIDILLKTALNTFQTEYKNLTIKKEQIKANNKEFRIVILLNTLKSIFDFFIAQNNPKFETPTIKREKLEMLYFNLTLYYSFSSFNFESFKKMSEKYSNNSKSSQISFCQCQSLSQEIFKDIYRINDLRNIRIKDNEVDPNFNKKESKAEGYDQNANMFKKVYNFASKWIIFAKDKAYDYIMSKTKSDSNCIDLEKKSAIAYVSQLEDSYSDLCAEYMKEDLFRKKQHYKDLIKGKLKEMTKTGHTPIDIMKFADSKSIEVLAVFLHYLKEFDLFDNSSEKKYVNSVSTSLSSALLSRLNEK